MTSETIPDIHFPYIIGTSFPKSIERFSICVFFNIRRVSNNNVKPAFVENVFEPGVPEEEVLVGGAIHLLQLGEGSGCATDALTNEGLYFIVDGLTHTGFLLVVGDGEILAQQALQVLATGMAINAQHQLHRFGLSAT